MLETQEQIKTIRSEIPKIDEIISKQTYSKSDIGEIEYFVSKICSIAETTKNFGGTTTITRIRELQKDIINYYDNLHSIVGNAKALLDSLDAYFGK